MFCWLEPASKTFVFHTEEFALAQLLDTVHQVQQDIQNFLNKQLQPNRNMAKAGVYHYEKQWGGI